MEAGALIAATVAVSFSAIFIRIAGGDAATIVWLRMSLAATLLAPFALRDVHAARFAGSPRDTALVIAGGVLLAGHFLLWTASLAYTSVASSVLLVSLHPLLVAPLGRRLLGERVTPRTAVGICLALAGTVITCSGDFRAGAPALAGDLLAIGGAACLAGYLLIGRGLSRSLAVAGYSATVYATVAVIAAAVSLAVGTAHMPSGRVLALGAALAVVCTLGGHTVYNWTLRRVRAVTVSIAFLGEPPLAALLAGLLLSNVPGATTIGGGALILAGVGLTLADRAPAPAGEPVVALE